MLLGRSIRNKAFRKIPGVAQPKNQFALEVVKAFIPLQGLGSNSSVIKPKFLVALESIAYTKY